MDQGPLTITAAAPLIRSGELTPSDLLEQCLARIDRYEEKVRAWVYLDRERARVEAAQLTDEIKAGHYRGPLHGIPVGIKDIIDVFDMPTGCGSKLWANSYARRDATCVRRLREAGALILGKTVTTAFASFDPPVTRNPWNLDRTPGGSSSGSAAAVACRMCLAALATQTGGSITRPASYCGVASLKPTWGRVSVDGVLPLAPTMDHLGVMANCVRDLATVFQVIAGADDRHPETMMRVVPDVFADDRFDRLADGQDWPNFTILDSTRELFPDRADPEVQQAIDEFTRLLTSGDPVRNRTCELSANALPPGFADVTAHHHVVMAVEAAAFHADRLARHPDDYPSRIRSLIERGLGYTGIEYAAAMERRRELIAACRNRFRFLLTPATPSQPPGRETTGDPLFNSPWSFIGLPTVSFPVGRTPDDLPVAVQIVSKSGWEDELLRVADWCEAAAAYPHALPPVT